MESVNWGVSHNPAPAIALPCRLNLTPDPRWAKPIKNRVRLENQARAVNEVVNACKSSPGGMYGDPNFGKLHVVNGMSTATSSSITTGAMENVSVGPFNYEGLPPRWGGGGSTLRAGIGGLPPHPEVREHDDRDGSTSTIDSPPPPPPKRPIIPSLTTMEKAVAARIYFENIYFPLFRHVPSREQRRLAMERDMAAMGLDHLQKEMLRERWRQNETEYLRRQRQKLDASAFVKLKTIGHGEKSFSYQKHAANISKGAFGVVSLVKERSTGSLYAMKQVTCPLNLRSQHTFNFFTDAQSRHVTQGSGGACAS